MKLTGVFQKLADWFRGEKTDEPIITGRAGPTYLIGKSREGWPWIYCFRCQMTSYNRKDIELKYCGKCHQFHSEISPGK